MRVEAPDSHTVPSRWARSVRFVTTNRWEFTLFLGLPLFWGGLLGPLYWFTTSLLFETNPHVTLLSTKIPILWAVSKVCYALPLVVFYWPVRRSGRPTLKLAWQLAIALLAAELIVRIGYPALGYAGLYRYPGSNFTYQFASVVARGIVFLWFARQAMKFSLGHGLLLAAAAMSFGSQTSWYLVHSVYGVGEVIHFATRLALLVATGTCIALAYSRFDSATASSRLRWLALLFALFLTMFVHDRLLIGPFNPLHSQIFWTSVREQLTFSAMFYGVTLAIAYLLGGEPDEAPDDDPNEIDDKSLREAEWSNQ